MRTGKSSWKCPTASARYTATKTSRRSQSGSRRAPTGAALGGLRPNLDLYPLPSSIITVRSSKSSAQSQRPARLAQICVTSGASCTYHLHHARRLVVPSLNCCAAAAGRPTKSVSGSEWSAGKIAPSGSLRGRNKKRSESSGATLILIAATEAPLVAPASTCAGATVSPGFPFAEHGLGSFHMPSSQSRPGRQCSAFHPSR